MKFSRSHWDFEDSNPKKWVQSFKTYKLMKKSKKLSFTSVMFSIDTITKVFEAVVGKEKYELE